MEETTMELRKIVAMATEQWMLLTKRTQNEIDEMYYNLGLEHPTYKLRVDSRLNFLRDDNKSYIMNEKLIPYYYQILLNDPGIQLHPIYLKEEAERLAESSFRNALTQGKLDELYCMVF
jgi:hypothetical protein